MTLLADRNQDYSIPQSACFSPCVWDGTGCWMPGPLDYGYLVSGPVETTTFGWRIPLRKFGASLYNGALNDIALEIFVYSEKLVRFKVDSEKVAMFTYIECTYDTYLSFRSSMTLQINALKCPLL